MNDKFCLNGQKLIAVKGVYGADGTEYRTESDDYTSITSYGVLGTAPNVAPKYFVVKMRDGRTMEFGGTDDSSPVFVGTTQGNGVPRSWALSKVADANQNYARYSYTGNPQTSAESDTPGTRGRAPALRLRLTSYTKPGRTLLAQIKVEVLKADGTASGYSKTTNTVFAEPDKVNWRIGRVIKSAVTSTAP